MSALRMPFLLACALLHVNAFASSSSGGWYVSSWGNIGPTYADQSTACVTGAPAAYKAAGGLDPSPSATWGGGVCTLHRSAYWGGDLTISLAVCGQGSKVNPQTGECLPLVESVDALAPQSCKTVVQGGNPIYPLTGAKKESIKTGFAIGGVELVLTYDSSVKVADTAPSLIEPNGFGELWRSNFHRKVLVTSGQRSALVSMGDGTMISFAGNGSGTYTAQGAIAHRLVPVSGGFRFENMLTASVETFDSSGRLTGIARADGATLTFSYTGDNLTAVTANDGRKLTFTYTGGLITNITAPDGRATTVAYDANGNLASLTWPDMKVLSFLYENASLPWALTGKVDENASRSATFAYDSAGRAVSSERAGGADSFSVSYGTPAQWLTSETFDAVAKVYTRTYSWQPPAGTVITNANGQTSSVDAQVARGQPVLSAKTQPAGSGCNTSSRGMTYDSSGNVASDDDFWGARTCYAYDSSNRETVRVEGLASTVTCSAVLPAGSTLPAGARKITTAWHPDWQLQTVITEPLRKTTVIYQGQPDPFNSNIAANCTTAANRSDGRPLPLVCKKVSQALSASGNVDSSVAAQTDTYTYDSAGRMLTHTDPRSNTTTYAYYSDSTFGDPDFSHVILLLSGNGTNGSTNIVDSSSAQRSFAASGNAQISTDQSYYGGSSLRFDGNGDYVQTTTNVNDFALGTDDFTIEFYANKGANGTAGYDIVLSTYSTPSASDGYWVELSSTRGFFFGGTGGNGSASVAYVQYGANPNDSAWHHWAITRSGTALKMFKDGTQVASGTLAVSLPAANFKVGADRYNEYFNGYLHLRITRGLARYIANFTPPIAFTLGTSPGATGHYQGDLWKMTNAAGQVTQYTQYDPAGRVRQMVDPKGIVTDIAYTPRGRVSTVTVTPPGGAARTTTYSYDNAGQMTGVLLPDGTSLAYMYDAAHRLTGVTDAQGNSISYTLDATGNRVGEDVRDASSTLKRSIARSFDALSRLQQVTGAAQ